MKRDATSPVETYPTIEAEESRLTELMSQRCTSRGGYHFEDDPEFQYLMARRIERFKRATNPMRGE